jgi:type I restriction enzyme S subunit
MKYKRYPKYKDSGIEWIGEIPEGWEVKKIKRDTPIMRGASPRPIDDQRFFDDEGEYAWVRISDVTRSNGKLQKTTQRLSDEGSSLSVKLHPGELFLSIAGSVGKPCVADIKCCIHDGFVYFPKLTINKKILYYIFEAGKCYGGLGKLGTQLNLNTDTVGNIKIPVPPKNESDEISEFLDKQTAQFDELIAKSKAQITLLEEKRQATITQAVTKGLDPSVPMKDSGVEWIGDIPQHWEVRKVKLSSYVKGRIGYHGLRSDEFIDEGPYLITGTDFKDGGINWNTCYHVPEWRYEQDPFIQIKNNDVLITKDGTVGKIAFIENIPGKTTLNSHLLVVRPLKNSYQPRFLYWILLADCFTYYVNLVQSGTIMNALSQEKLENFVFPLPPILEENQITEFLDKQITQFDELIAKSKAQITLLEEKRQALITATVTGKIDVRSEVVA